MNTLMRVRHRRSAFATDRICARRAMPASRATRRRRARSLRPWSRSARPNAFRTSSKPLQALGSSGAIRGILIPQGPSAASGARVGVERRRAQRPAGPLHRQRGRGAAAVEPADGGLVARRPDRGARQLDQAGRSRRARRRSARAGVEVRASSAFERAAFSDLRWTRLTRWRALMAQFFDLPEVQAAAVVVQRTCASKASDRACGLAVRALDARPSCEWDDSGDDRDSRTATAAAPIARVSLTGGSRALHLRLAKSRTCVESAAQVGQSGDVAGRLARRRER